MSADNSKKIDVVKIRKPTEYRMPEIEAKEFVRQLVEVLARELVSYPEDISVRFSCGEKTTLYHIDCTQRVIGQLMGSKGRNINGIRAVVQSITQRKGFRSIIEIPYFPDNQ